MNVYQRFRSLHESGTFVIPNPWDAGSLRLLVCGRHPQELTDPFFDLLDAPEQLVH